MRARLFWLFVILLIPSSHQTADVEDTPVSLPSLAAHAPPTRMQGPDPEDRALYMAAAERAWEYVEISYQPSTGLVNSVIGYPYTTMWDTGSALAAFYSAHELGLLPQDEYDRRIRRVLSTLRTLPLFREVAFNKNYSTLDGRMVERDGSPSSRGYGWSALDLGRLLVWLRILATQQPEYARDVELVVARIDARKLIQNGYLQGGNHATSTDRFFEYQEGRIGYEQYAARGFALWGFHAERALRLTENSQPVTILDVPLLKDRRHDEQLTSEPFVLAGLELGWNPIMEHTARHVLAVQQERYRRTGQVTIVSEDAISEPPYFLYYAIYSNGEEFKVSPPDGAPPGRLARTVSTKAALGWHALLPSPYTRKAVATVSSAYVPGQGWSAGVYEDSHRPTGSPNINTSAAILEAALFALRQRPLIIRDP